MIGWIAAALLQTGFEEKRLGAFDLPRNSELTFSSDGRRYAYVLRDTDGKSRAVVDGNPVDPRGSISRLHFSPDSRRYAFVEGGLGSPQRVILDGRPLDPAGTIEAIAFSPDGKVFAFAVSAADGAWVVVEGKKTGPYPGFGQGFATGTPLVFNPGGTSLAFLVTDGEAVWVVRDGKAEVRYDSIRGLSFSEQGDVLAYRASKGLLDADWNFAVVDGRASERFEALSRISLSRDGKTAAYGAVDLGGKACIVVGGKKTPTPHLVGPVLHPDGKTTAYPIQEASGRVVMLAGTEKSEAFRTVGPAFFSPSGTMGFVAGTADGNQLVVFGGRRGPSFRRIDLDGGWGEVQITSPLRFSPDGKRLAYRASRNAFDWDTVVVGDKVIEGYLHVSVPVFSPDGLKIAFGGVKGKEIWWKVEALAP